MWEFRQEIQNIRKYQRHNAEEYRNWNENFKRGSIAEQMEQKNGSANSKTGKWNSSNQMIKKKKKLKIA